MHEYTWSRGGNLIRRVRRDAELVAEAKELRRNMTVAERRLWHWLRARQLGGLKFRRQHPLQGFIADFYCHAARLVVEVDGASHDDDRDKARDAIMNAAGMAVIRFTNDEVLLRTEAVVKEIVKVGTERSSELNGSRPPAPALQLERGRG